VIGVVEVVVVVNIFVVKISSVDMTRHLFCEERVLTAFYYIFISMNIFIDKIGC